MKKILGAAGLVALSVAMTALALTAFHSHHTTPQALTTRESGNVIVQWADGRLVGKGQVTRAKCGASSQYPGATSCILAISDGECVGVTAAVKGTSAPDIKDAQTLPASYCK